MVSESEILLKYDLRHVRDLGCGTYGKVFKARNLKTDEEFAVKKIFLDENDEGIPSTALREISLLKAISHDNVVKLEGVIREPAKLYLIFELAQYDLKKLMKLAKEKRVHPQIAKSFLWQMLRGIDLCHANRVLHRDLKPQNILITREGVLKIADFGLARAFNVPLRKYTHEVVTLWYRAPEILLGCDNYDGSCDIWSAGLIYAEMLRAAPILMGDSEIDQLLKIFTLLGTPTEANWSGVSSFRFYKNVFPKFPGTGIRSKMMSSTDEQALDLIEKVLPLKPSSRLTASQCLSHSLFTDIAEVQRKLPELLRDQYCIV